MAKMKFILLGCNYTLECIPKVSLKKKIYFLSCLFKRLIKENYENHDSQNYQFANSLIFIENQFHLNSYFAPFIIKEGERSPPFCILLKIYKNRLLLK